MTAQLMMFPDPAPPAAAVDLTFELWWRQYPHRVCKGQARKAWAGAIRKASFAQLMDGVARYKVAKHVDVPWCNPATWLNGERWLDEPATNSRTHDPDLELRNQAKAIAAGITCPSATPRKVAMMVERGWLTKEQACKAGLI